MKREEYIIYRIDIHSKFICLNYYVLLKTADYFLTLRYKHFKIQILNSFKDFRIIICNDFILK